MHCPSHLLSLPMPTQASPMPEVPWQRPLVQRLVAWLQRSLDLTWMQGSRAAGCTIGCTYLQFNIKPQRSGEKDHCFPLFHALSYLASPLLCLPKLKVPSKGLFKSRESLSLTPKGAELGHVCSVQLPGSKSMGAAFMKAGPSPVFMESKGDSRSHAG